MSQNIFFYNSYSREKERFKSINNNYVGIYLCGPTVYGPPHIGHARSSITFDLINRYLRFCGYNVKFIRNYTDVGHLEYDSDDGDDKIEKQAKKEQIDPMEIVQKYINIYRKDMQLLNCLSPNIEPQATSCIQEQIEFTHELISKGFAYEINGSVYFDVQKYNAEFNDYGILSGRNIEEIYTQTRELKNQNEKKNSYDFALWKKADERHIMKWDSPWGLGFPGWHTECVVLSKKYLGQLFDIHGGGIDLKFPHHEAEITQAKASFGTRLANFWIHNNLVNINDQKMSKSLNNFITLDELFFNENNIFNRTFSPSVLRFLFLETHYRSTLNISFSALESAEKGYLKLMNTLKKVKNIECNYSEDNANEKMQENIEKIFGQIYFDLADDLNTPKVLANLFELSKIINDIDNNKISISEFGNIFFNKFKKDFSTIIEDVLGLKVPEVNTEYIDLILEIYKEAKWRKDFTQVNFLRSKMKHLGIVFCDKKTSVSWNYEI